MLTYYSLVLCALSLTSLPLVCQLYSLVAELRAANNTLVYTTGMLHWSMAQHERCNTDLSVEKEKVGDSSTRMIVTRHHAVFQILVLT
jgi:hypothetical protein